MIYHSLMVQTLLSITLIGLMVAAVSKIIVPGRVGQGFFMTMVMSVFGAFLGAASGMDEQWFEDGRTTGLLAAMIGAIVMVSTYRYWRHHRPGRDDARDRLFRS